MYIVFIATLLKILIKVASPSRKQYYFQVITLMMFNNAFYLIGN